MKYYLPYNKDITLGAISYTASDGTTALSPATAGVSYTYDMAYPSILTMTDGTGVTTYVYNAVVSGTLGSGRLASITSPLADSAVSYVYDALGRITSVAINGTANASTVAYDALGRVTSAVNNLGTFAYAYVNQTSRLSGVTYPNGQVTNYSYYPNTATTPGNDDQRLAQITNLAASGGANISTFGYTYNATGNIMTWSKQNDTGAALTSGFTYDAADQLIRAAVPTSATATRGYSYGYDKAGNRTREQIDANVNSATFNNVNQLTAQSPGGKMEFAGTLNEFATLTLKGATDTAENAATVDSSNNWRGTATVTTGANSIALVATDASGNASTHTISITVTGNAARTLTYDLNGNLTNNGDGQTYTWDAENRLTKITYSDGSYSSFVYNGLGQRVQITETDASGTTTSDNYFVWAGGAQPVEERDAANTVTKRFYAQGEWIPNPAGTTHLACCYLKDHLGSVRELTGPAKAVRARYDYDPYGRLTKVSGNMESDFGYTGMYRHQKSGLDLTLYRAYDPELGRWISRDPIGENGGLNLYGYVGGNPVNVTDGYGLFGDGYNGNAGPNDYKGHSDFYGHDRYDFTKDDHGFSSPFNQISTGRHFKCPSDAENDVEAAISSGDRDGFERAMHRLQDTFTHYDKGYRYDPVIGMASMMYSQNIGAFQTAHTSFGHAFDSTYFDQDNNAWNAANALTKTYVYKFDFYNSAMPVSIDTININNFSF